MAEVPAMPKDKLNSQQGYKYLSETTVKELLRGILVKYNVFFQVSAEEIDFIEIGKTAKGTPIWLTKTRVLYTFYDADSGESMGGHYTSQGADMSDKGVYKAVTGAVKNILMQNFLIPTGDDPEKDLKPLKAPTKQVNTSDIKPCGEHEFNTMMTTGEFNLDSGMSKKTGKPFYIADFQNQRYWLTEEQFNQLKK